METRWGLDLDMSAVRLMSRQDGQWVEKAVEKIDSPDIEERLAEMVSAVPEGARVMLFLPKDQILCTKVELDDDAPHYTQIERAMDGRTPYTLDELSLDWEIGDGAATVAAIARDTLDEAAAFAEVRGLPIAGYSSLALGGDFPRLPEFDGPNIAAPTEEVDDEPSRPVSFTSARTPSHPPDAALAAASLEASARAKARLTPLRDPAPARPEGEPVVMVEDATPVLRIKAPQAPLDPGLPISAPNAPPRIRTDIAAASVSDHAASLTPPISSVKLRRSGPSITPLAVLAVAFLLTIGIAVLVWNVLPMRPGATTGTPAGNGQNIAVDTTPEDNAAVLDTAPPAEESTVLEQLPQPAPQPEAPAEEAVAIVEPLLPAEEVTQPELPQPGEPQADAPALTIPDADAAPKLAALDPQPEAVAAPQLGAPQGAAAVPAYDPETPAPPTPENLAGILTAAPAAAAPPEAEETSDGIQLGAFELPGLGLDAVALPDADALAADAPPEVEGAQVAGLEPDATIVNDLVGPAVERALIDALAGPGGLIQTELAANLPETTPRRRPADITERIEREKFGGRTREQLAQLRPPARPDSAQTLAESAPAATASALGIPRSSAPRTRPGDFEARIVAAALAQRQAEQVTATAEIDVPDTSAAIQAALAEDIEPPARPDPPERVSIPSSASVSRQATIENAIRLNQINLVGVYGTPSDRRALIRLSSGRYVKVKVGDRVDGGTVAQITDSQLIYRKGSRNLSLTVPQG